MQNIKTTGKDILGYLFVFTFVIPILPFLLLAITNR